jgi:hypothetical protein
MSGLVIEFVLEIVIFLFKFLGELPDDIILKLKEFSLFFIVFHKNSSFSEFSGKVIRENINLYFKLLSSSIFNIFINLSIFVKEAKHVRCTM